VLPPPRPKSTSAAKPTLAPRVSRGSSGGSGGSEVVVDDDDEYLAVADDSGAFSESKEDEYEKPASAKRDGFSLSDPTEPPPPVPAKTEAAPPPQPAAAAAAKPSTVEVAAAAPPPVVPPRAPVLVFAGDDLELKRAVRQLLRAEGIGLWEAPYSLDDGRSSMPSDLADRYASSLVAGASRVFDALETLRISSRKKQKLSIPPAGEAARTYDEAIKEVATLA